MKKNLHLLLSLMLVFLVSGLAMAQSPLTHSFSFKDGEPVDDVTGAAGELMGEAYVDGTDLILPDNTSYLDLSALGIEINTYSALTIEAWATAEDGANPGFTMLVYLGGTTGTLGTQGCFISAARQDDVSRGAISTVSLDAPWGGNETGVNGPEYDDGELHYYVLTIDDTELTFYVDGEAMGSADLADVGNSIADMSNEFAYIGKGGYTADPCWIGTVHKVNIYNEVLSEDDVLQLTIDPNIGGTDAVKNLNNSFKPKVYSANNSINISLFNTGVDNASAELYDLSGRKIESIDFNKSTSFNATKGMYIVKVAANDNVYTQKVSVQ